jgi:Fe-S-cluster containining protein
MTAASYDCVRCGACCINPPENVLEGYDAYVEIAPRDTIRARADLLRKYTHETEGKLHMRILSDGRCIALSGRVGERVQCRIYYARPLPCRRVQAGSELCHRYRREQGI